MARPVGTRLGTRHFVCFALVETSRDTDAREERKMIKWRGKNK